MPPALSRVTCASIFKSANSSPRFHQLIAGGLDSPLASEIRALAGPISCGDAQIVREVLTMLHNKMPAASEALCSSLTKRRIRQKRMRNVHHDVIRELGLDWTPAEVEDWNRSLPTLHLPKLKSPYPPPGKFVCEDEAIKELWTHRLTVAKQADKRLKRCEPALVDFGKLARTVGVSENLVVRDSKTEEVVLMVVRHFCRNIDAIAWMEEIAAEAAEICRDIRKEDPGHLSLAGFSAGSRSQPQFHWARNIIRKLPPEEIFDFRQQQSFAFALFWNILLKHLPAKILSEWNSWIDQEMLPGMTPSWSGDSRGDAAGPCTFPVYNETVKLNSTQYAPPAGVMAQNYSRAIHFEKQPHKWAASHTLCRDSFEDGDGGHFYLAAYGIRIMSAPDTLVVWQPRHYHGTSLQRLDPYNLDPSKIQRGMSFVTSSRLPGIWRRYVGELKRIEAEKISRAEKDARAQEAAAASELALASLDGDEDDDIYFAAEVGG